MLSCLLSTIFAQEFEFDAEDYYSSENNNPVNSEEDTSADKNSADKKSMNSNEDTDKEVCIDNQQQIESAPSYFSNSDLSSDSSSYSSTDYHFIKKFDREGNLVDSWGRI